VTTANANALQREPDAAAIGRVAEAILRKAGLLEQAQKSIAMRAGNVPELGYLVKLKSLDVSIVWRMTAKEIADDTDIVPIPETLSPPIAVPIGVLKFSEHKDIANGFIDWLTGPEGQKLAKDSWKRPANE
jgi:molybdate transport system substrate-binding protein